MTAHREHDVPNAKCEACRAKCMVCNRPATVFGEAWGTNWYGLWRSCGEHRSEAVDRLEGQLP